MSRFARLWLTATGIGAAITLFAPSIVIIAAITVIGLPVAIALLLAPLVFVVSLGGWYVGRALDVGRKGYGIGAAVVLLALAVPPSLINARLERRAAALVAKDVDLLRGPLRARALAVRSDRPPRFGKDETPCDGFCLRALLNGVAERVLFVRQDLNDPLDAAMPARSFRLERRSACPAVHLGGGHDEIKDASRRDRTSKLAHERMQIEIAKGNCLIEETVPLGTADVVLSRGTVHRGKSVIAAGLDPTADTVNASRISVHERDGSGFREIYRRTGVVTYLLAPVLAPTAEGAAELRAYAVLARRASRRNLDSRYERDPDWNDFLTKTLALDLALHEGAAEDETRTILSRATASAGPLDAAVVELGDDFVDGISRGRNMMAEDRGLARAVLTDARFRVPRNGWAAVRYATDVGDDYFDAIATAMFQRLARLAADDDGKPYPAWREDAGRIAAILHELPAATILRQRSGLDWLAEQERLRVWTYRGLIRLHEFGADAAPTLLWLMDEAVRLKDAYRSDWNNVYLAGLIGLCRMGPAGREMVGPIYQRLASGAMVKHGSYWDLTIETLVGMGADPDEMWTRLQTDDRNHTRSRFDSYVARAKRKRDCVY